MFLIFLLICSRMLCVFQQLGSYNLSPYIISCFFVAILQGSAFVFI